MNDDMKKLADIGRIGSSVEQLKKTLPLNIGEALKAHELVKGGKLAAGGPLDLLRTSGAATTFFEGEARRQQDRMNEMNRLAQSTADHHARIARAQHNRDNPVLAVFEELHGYIKEFEDSLDDDEIVGARLVTFGQDTKFHIKSLGYSTPCLIHFDGTDTDGNRVRLVQNISQLSVLFVAMRLPEGEEKLPIGFIYPDK